MIVDLTEDEIEDLQELIDFRLAVITVADVTVNPKLTATVTRLEALGVKLGMEQDTAAAQNRANQEWWDHSGGRLGG